MARLAYLPSCGCGCGFDSGFDSDFPGREAGGGDRGTSPMTAFVSFLPTPSSCGFCSAGCA